MPTTLQVVYTMVLADYYPNPNETTSRLSLAPLIDHAGFQDAEKKCQLLGPVALVVQGCMGVFVVLSLVVKRQFEGNAKRGIPKRRWRVWSMDVGKQLIGQGFVHFLNVWVSPQCTMIGVLRRSSSYDLLYSLRYQPESHHTKEISIHVACTFSTCWSTQRSVSPIISFEISNRRANPQPNSHQRCAFPILGTERFHMDVRKTVWTRSWVPEWDLR